MLCMCRRASFTVPATTLWTSPKAPRDVDGWATAPLTEVHAWLADLDYAGARRGLHGRVLTQLECGEPVLVTGGPDGRAARPAGQRWLQIAAPTQPSNLDARGYPGWVLAGTIGQKDPDCPQPATAANSPGTGADPQVLIAVARTHCGVPYLWGGMCEAALDCSGLVHLSLRRLRVVVPRDDADQYDACEHIPAGKASPGDLLSFAHRGQRAHHVGIVTVPGRTLHAPQTGSKVTEEPLTPARMNPLIGAGRLPVLLQPTVSAH
jgi:gamma-D-glutamyl-L-lysine dipeptidyl-peptidase